MLLEKITIILSTPSIDERLKGFCIENVLQHPNHLSLSTHILSRIISAGIEDRKWTIITLESIFKLHASSPWMEGRKTLSEHLVRDRLPMNWFSDLLIGLSKKFGGDQDSGTVNCGELIFDLIDHYVANCCNQALLGSFYEPVTESQVFTTHENLYLRLVFGYYLLRMFHSSKRGDGNSIASLALRFEQLYHFDWILLLNHSFASLSPHCMSKVVGLLNQLIPNIFMVRNQLLLLSLSGGSIESPDKM